METPETTDSEDSSKNKENNEAIINQISHTRPELED